MFANRADAGRQLADRLKSLPTENLVVLALPRGGVPVAAEVANVLHVPLDVIVVRKLGVPFQPELAMGAIGEDGVRILNRDVLRRARLTNEEFEAVETREREELARRAARFRGPGARTSLAGRAALIIDDGIATGSTVQAACHVARAHGAARVIVAVPVAPPGAADALREVADDVIVLQSPTSFGAIGEFYRDFSQTSDTEVVRLLERSRGDGSDRDGEVVIEAGSVRLDGHLTVPRGASAIVVFAHGSGSSRHSARNRYVAGALNRCGIGTLLFDLLTTDEEQDRSNVFDIELLAGRLVAATRWLREQPEARRTRLGYFGASTGAAAALTAATLTDVSAVVSRGGRPDLAGSRLAAVEAPTLLIVGGDDPEVLELNRLAAARLRCDKRLVIVPGATHLFEEPGTLEAVANLARDWFLDHLVSAASA